MSSYTFFLVLLKPDDSSFIPGNPELQNDLVADDKEQLDDITLATGFGGLTDIVTGPDGLLYVLTYDQEAGSGGGINWEQLCMKYGDLIGISSDRCDQYAQGTRLTQAGEDVLVCNLITRVPAALGDAGTGVLGGLAAQNVGIDF